MVQDVIVTEMGYMVWSKLVLHFGSENLIRCRKLQPFKWLKLQLLLAKFIGSLNPKSFGQSIVVS